MPRIAAAFADAEIEQEFRALKGEPHQHDVSYMYL